MSTEPAPGGQPVPQPQDDEPHPGAEQPPREEARNEPAHDGQQQGEPSHTEPPQGGYPRPEAPPTGHVRPGPPRGNDFFSWIRGLGVTRGGDRWMGGVASGLAHRWGVDPILVRGLFIVAAIFLGIGVLAYGVLWLLLPEPDGRIHVQEAAHGRWSGGMTGGLIVTILGFGGARAGFWFGERGVGGAFWGLFWVAVVACCIYSVVRGSRRRAMYGHGAGGAPAGAPAPGDSYYGKPTSPPSYATGYGAYAGQSPRPHYRGGADYAGNAPYNVAPGYADAPAAPPYYGGSLPPVAAPVHHRPPRRPRASAPYTLVVLGLAALVAGALGVLGATGAVSLAASAVWTVVAILVGLGILVAGLRGRGAGILSLFAIVALVAGAATQGAERFSNLHSRQSSYAPASVQQATGGYDITAERGTLDLSALDTSGPLASEAVIPIKTTMSDVTITVPKDIPVQVRSSETMANVRAQGQSSAGLTRHDTTTYNSAKPGAALVLQLDATLSSVTINEER